MAWVPAPYLLEYSRMLLRKINMSIIQMRGWGAKGFTSTGGVVSPSIPQKKLSSKLTVMGTQNNVLYAKG